MEKLGSRKAPKAEPWTPELPISLLRSLLAIYIIFPQNRFEIYFYVLWASNLLLFFSSIFRSYLTNLVITVSITEHWHLEKQLNSLVPREYIILTKESCLFSE